jgi:predicted nucleic acid-binding protein
MFSIQRGFTMLNVYIDAQRWLSIYEFSNDNHEQFSKLVELIDNGEINVFLPEQTYEEVLRNRENKIRDALKQFEKLNTPAIPNLCRGYGEYKTFRELINHMEIFHRDFLRKIHEDINAKQLYADKVLDELFTKINRIQRTQSLIDKAKIRFDVGNPPGKDKSYGDAISWETLLETVPDGENIYFISSDKDYKSVLDEVKLNQYLHDEWNRIKGSKIFFHTSLTDFISMHLKSIELKSENDKEELIGLLANTPNFGSTHSVISRLSQFSNWTDNQVIRLLQAADRNNQVYWIINDYDISSFYNGLLADRKDRMLKNPELSWILDRLGYKDDLDNEEEIIENDG